VVSAQEALKDTTARPAGSIHFHPLELESVETARRSAEDFKKKTDDAGKRIERLDIIVGNAGTAFHTLDTLSPDGFERTFAVNCLGHYVFITSLLGTQILLFECKVLLFKLPLHRFAQASNNTMLTCPPFQTW
jgi:NAD(P)-dependent dehydrogenase (short-subunit alcohol dehydrogenase family)